MSQVGWLSEFRRSSTHSTNALLLQEMQAMGNGPKEVTVACNNTETLREM